MDSPGKIGVRQRNINAIYGRKRISMASEIENSKSNILQMNQRFGSYLPVIVDLETGGVVCETDAILELSASYLRLDKHGVLHASEPDTYHVLPFEGANLNPKAMAIHVPNSPNSEGNGSASLRLGLG